MKSIYQSLTIALLMLCLCNTQIIASTLTIGNSERQTKTPINYYYTDTYQGCQMIYTEDELGDLEKNAEIKSIAFYYRNSSSSSTAPLINFSIKMGVTQYSNFSSNSCYTSNLTEIANTKIGGWSKSSSGWVTIELQTPFKYTGGNLLIEIRNTEKGSYSNSVDFDSSSSEDYKTLSWTSASSATTNKSGTRSTYRPDIKFSYTLNSALTGESGISYIYCPKPGMLRQLYEEYEYPRPTKLKIGGIISGRDFADMQFGENDTYDDYYNTPNDIYKNITYLDLSDVTIEECTYTVKQSGTRYDYSTKKNEVPYVVSGLYSNSMKTVVLPDNCEYFTLYGQPLKDYGYVYWTHFYTNNPTPFGDQIANIVLHVPSGSKNNWENKLSKIKRYENDNFIVVDTPIKSVSNLYSLTSEELNTIDILEINGSIGAEKFEMLNKMPELNVLIINGDITAGRSSDYVYYPANEIPADAFKDNKSLRFIDLKRCDKIGDRAFQNATGLIGFRRSGWVGYLAERIIGDYAFDGCVNLSQVVHHDSPFYASVDWWNDYSLHYGFTSIGDFAFRNTKVSSIQLSSYCLNNNDEDGEEYYDYDNHYVPFTHVGKNPFFGVYNTNGVKSSYDFIACVSWSNNHYNRGPFSLDQDCNGYSYYPYSEHPYVDLLIKQQTLYASAVSYPCAYIMDNYILHVADYGISDVAITELTISSNLTTIGDAFLYKCKDLKSIKGSSKAFVAKNSVLYNAAMDSLIKYPSNHPFEEFHIPTSVKYIETWAFEGLNNLKDLYVYSNKPICLGENVFENVDLENFTLHVPYGKKAVYEADEKWGVLTNIVEMGISETYYDLNISDAGYATLYLDYATEIPEGVEVYTAKEVDGIWLKMSQVEDVLPANTGVIVKAAAGTYTFVQTITDAPAITDNLFMGSTEDEYIDVSLGSKAFILSKIDGDVGMYLAKLTNGRFLNNANKAYLLLDNNKLGLSDEEVDSSEGGAQLSLRFDFGSATGIDAVQTETEKVIYDLYGRKVNQITGSGIYIIGGKKVYVR